MQGLYVTIGILYSMFVEFYLYDHFKTLISYCYTSTYIKEINIYGLIKKNHINSTQY